MVKLKDLNLLEIGNTIQLTGAIYSGNGKHFLCFFPDESPDSLPSDILHMTRDEWETFIRQTDLLETEIIAEHPENKQMIKAVIRKSQRQIDQNISWQVYRRDGYRCRYCGKDDVPLTVDHVVLWESGGPSIESNLISACKKCNRTRGNTEYSEWLKSDYYRRVSQNLEEHTREGNREVVHSLAMIPRVVHKRNR
jgi:5-methylcytosine-specific restriction endonuclease McrA